MRPLLRKLGQLHATLKHPLRHRIVLQCQPSGQRCPHLRHKTHIRHRRLISDTVLPSRLLEHLLVDADSARDPVMVPFAAPAPFTACSAARFARQWKHLGDRGADAVGG